MLRATSILPTLAATAGATIKTVGKQTIWVPANSMTPSTTSGAATGSIETANGQNVEVLDFDATADEHACFNIAMPKGWNESTVTFQAFWCSTATDTDGVAWGLQAVAMGDNEALNQSYGTPIVVTDDAQSATTEVYVTAESAAITIAGTPAEGDLVTFRFFRDVSDANDDMTEDARLIGIKLFYTDNAATDV